MSVENGGINGNYVKGLIGTNLSDGTAVVIGADPITGRLYVDANISSAVVTGNKSNNAVVPGSTNLGVLPAIATNANPTYTEGFQVGLSTDLDGNLRVTGSLSIGGTIDNSAFTAGTSEGTPAMGFYHSTIDTVTDGRAAAFAMDSKRSQFMVIRDAALNARGANVDANNNLGVVLPAETTKVLGTVRVVGNVGGIFDQATGSAVPANALYMGLNDGTNLRGHTANSSATSGKYAADANILSFAGTLVDTNSGNMSAGTQRNVIATDQVAIPLWGHGATGAAVPANATQIGISDGTNLRTPTANSSATSGKYAQDVNLLTVANTLVAAGNGASSAAVRVTVSNDSTGVIQPIAGIAGGYSISYAVSANSNNKTQAKGTAGQIYFISVENISSAPVYLKIFDNTSAGVTMGTTNATYQFMCPANATAANGAGIVLSFPQGILHATGITWALTTGIASNDNTSVSANIAIVTIGYK